MITCCEFYQILWTERNTFVMRQKEVVIHKAQTKCLQCSAGWKGVNINNKKKTHAVTFKPAKTVVQCRYYSASMQTDETAIYRDYDSVESKQLPWQLQAWRQSVAEGMRHSDIDRLSTTSLPATSHITSCTFTHTPSCTVLRYAALCSAALCCAVLHCAVLHCVVLCCAMLHCAVLNCVVLCCAVLHYVAQHCAVCC